MASDSLAKAMFDAVMTPRDAERDHAIAEARQRLPESVMTAHQALGLQNAGCAATINVMEQCNLSCQACYAAASNKSTPPMPLDDVRAQLVTIRRYLGPWANVQLTGGEVTMLPVERLVAILKICQELQLDAMLMTNGEVFRHDPDYLRRLVVEGGLQKIALHVDTTQRGRVPVQTTTHEMHERDLRELRDELADQVRRVRAETGKPLQAAHTFTVTDSNVDDLPEVLSWVVDNTDVFYIFSLQPAAPVGSTSKKQVASAATRDKIWSRLSEGFGVPINQHTFVFGHPACSSIALALIADIDGKKQIIEVHRQDDAIDGWIIAELLASELAGFTHDGDRPPVAVARLLSLLIRNPKITAKISIAAARRLVDTRRVLVDALVALAKGRSVTFRPLAIIAHNFMGPDELETALGRERLEACAFRLPVDDRMVSMCSMNTTGLRDQLNQEVTHRDPLVLPHDT